MIGGVSFVIGDIEADDRLFNWLSGFHNVPRVASGDTFQLAGDIKEPREFGGLEFSRIKEMDSAADFVEDFFGELCVTAAHIQDVSGIGFSGEAVLFIVPGFDAFGPAIQRGPAG